MTLHTCHNRPPFTSRYPVQDGWKFGGGRKIIYIDNRNTKTCQFNERVTHPRCAACIWINPIPST